MIICILKFERLNRFIKLKLLLIKGIKLNLKIQKFIEIYVIKILNNFKYMRWYIVVQG